jgi:hypothetical protein
MQRSDEAAASEFASNAFFVKFFRARAIGTSREHERTGFEFFVRQAETN